MRTRTLWPAWLMTAVLALTPLIARGDDPSPADPQAPLLPFYYRPDITGLVTTARGQDYMPADPPTPLPLFHNRPETGGLFLTAEYAMYQQSNSLGNQPIAIRGFFDSTGAITGTVGRLVGPGNVALQADQASGPATYQPGFRLGGGWKFRDGTVMSVNWMNLLSAKYSATASTIPFPGRSSLRNLSDTLLTSPVFNFTPDYGGPQLEGFAIFTGLPAPDAFADLVGAAYGIWNAADVMTIEFTQRYNQIDFDTRIPIFETENWRSYGLVGARFSWFWERFLWRTVDYGQRFLVIDNPPDPDLSDLFRDNIPDTFVFTPVAPTVAPLASDFPTNVAIYTNIVSNRMYGPTVGWGNEWYLGQGLAFTLDLRGSVMVDVVKERARYELGLKYAGPVAKRSRTEFTVVPHFQANMGLWMYPIEGVQLRCGYDAMVFFNTVGARNPVSFNFGGLDPAWERVTRWLHGFNAGVGITF